MTDVLGQGWLRYVQLVRRLGERATLDDLCEVAKLPEIHTRVLTVDADSALCTAARIKILSGEHNSRC